LHFPSADLKAMDHGLRSFTHAAFAPAVDKVKSSIDQEHDAFAMAAGIDAAVVLAGFGLPVAPFDKEQRRIVGEPSNDIDTVLRLFVGSETALVAYSVCTAPFYVLLTDCVRTLYESLAVSPELAQVKRLFLRYYAQLPPNPTDARFASGMALFRRRQGDKVRTIALIDPSPDGGSVVLHAGWKADGRARGAPNGGYTPVPIPLLQAIIDDPLIAAAHFFPGRRARPTMH
jgi:hypothetical protein